MAFLRNLFGMKKDTGGTSERPRDLATTAPDFADSPLATQGSNLARESLDAGRDVEVVKVSFDGPAVPVYGGELRLRLSTSLLTADIDMPHTYTLCTPHCGGQSLGESGGQVSVGQRDYEIKAMEHSGEGVIYSMARAPQVRACNTAFKANMSNGPQIFDWGGGVWYGTYQVLHFTAKDKGRIPRVTVDSGGPTLCIEFYKGVFDGDDSMSWAKNRMHIIRSHRQPKPELTWSLEPGDYTLYIVAYDAGGKIANYDIEYSVEIN